MIVFVILVGIVTGVLVLEKYSPLKKLFHYLPAPFWCYFIPMTLSSLNLLPAISPVYTFLTTYVLAACLWLLLLNVRLWDIARVGPTAAMTMAVGTLGIGIGSVLSYAVFSPWLGTDMWKGVGAISASWTGGSINMLAVKEALAMPDADFAPFVILDTVVTYVWMGLLIALAPWQDRWDQWVQADRTTLEATAQHLGTASPKTTTSRFSIHSIGLLGFGLLIGWACVAAGAHMPPNRLLSASAWSFIIVSVLGLLSSLTPAAQLERYGASRMGYFCLYLLLAAIGARARFSSIFQTPALLVMAGLLVAIHAVLLGLFGWWRRLPLFFLVTASQANIGGTASAPIVAGIYQPALAPLGLLLAVAANIGGTYIGILIAHACHIIQR